MPVIDHHHTLVVGGTGMLRGVCLYYANQGHAVSVIGRDRGKLVTVRASAEGSSGIVDTICVDYSQDESLRAKLEMAVERHGKFDLAIAWIHSTAPRALEITAEVLNKTSVPCKLFQVCSSEFLSPEKKQYALSATGKIRLDAVSDEARLIRFDMVEHHRIVLGFHVENGSSRWLTNEEICGGILEAISAGQQQFVVGTVSPWSARPAV